MRRNCLLKQVIEGKVKEDIEVIRRQERRRKKLLDDLKDRRGCSHLKEEALDRNMWRNRFGRGYHCSASNLDTKYGVESSNRYSFSVSDKNIKNKCPFQFFPQVSELSCVVGP